MEPQQRENQINGQMRIMQWVWTIVLTGIPIVNIIMLIIWAADRTNPRRNYSIAMFIVMAAFIVIYFIIFMVFMILGIALMPDSDPTYSDTYYY
ncbi:hypothetical protein SAMN05421663_104239 [Terribacillus halophilus]|uniref:Uncharacterized protein n=1 Tax=Terribacillus halophilus TaxID=361279 RepID=A0A1G6PRE6_9BACI|nr:hypothetical protein [Terribacillus halophilus]SDC82812.1 hypothetical protein SAMN05421663_104239 [Terribacillus halophilus]